MNLWLLFMFISAVITIILAARILDKEKILKRALPVEIIGVICVIGNGIAANITITASRKPCNDLYSDNIVMVYYELIDDDILYKYELDDKIYTIPESNISKIDKVFIISHQAQEVKMLTYKTDKNHFYTSTFGIPSMEHYEFREL